MNSRQWLAIVLGAAWVGQIHNLWPLPPATVEELAASLPSESRHLATAMEPDIWLGWIMRAAVIPLGIASAVLLFRQHRKWRLAVLLVGAVCLLIFRPWVWIAVWYAPLFTTLDRAAGRGEWLLGKPLLVFDTLIFPAVVVAAMVYAIAVFARQSRGRHAI